MMRTLGILAVGGVVLVAICMCLALIGRVHDLSPFGLVLAGACAGWLVAFGSIMAAWTDE